MKQVSIALILARIAQIISLILIIFIFFPNVDFSNPNPIALTAFLLVLGSVFLSGLVQYFYVYWKGKKFMKFKLNFDKNFIKEKLKTNWKYGLSYYLSSFHTLIVLIFLSIIFPTEK
jgi:O-antigen/teichoic acid export membrane protein